MKAKYTPSAISVFLDNEELELARLICVLSNFKGRKTGIRLSELVYYYTLSVSEFEFETQICDIQTKARYNIVNLYVDFQSKVNGLVIKLSSIGYLSVSGDINSKYKDILIFNTKTGLDFANDLTSEYFLSLKARVERIKKYWKYSKGLENELFERGIL